MIEECGYCGEEHETAPDGESFNIGGIPVKICPKMPLHTIKMLNGFPSAPDRQSNIPGLERTFDRMENLSDEWPEVIQ
jgi:hypothetical protein